MHDLSKRLEDRMKLFANLPEKRASENPVGTIPDDQIATSARPDIVLVEFTGVKLLKLTIPHNSQESMYKAKVMKSKKENHQKVSSDFDAMDLSAELHTLAIGYPVPEGLISKFFHHLRN